MLTEGIIRWCDELIEKYNIKPMCEVLVDVDRLMEKNVLLRVYPHEHRGAMHKGNIRVTDVLNSFGSKAIGECVMPGCRQRVWLIVRR